MQPQFVFVGLKRGFNRRPSVHFEPAMYGTGQRADFDFGFVRHAAREPGFRKQEGDRLHLAQASRVLLLPSAPEPDVPQRLVALFIEESCDLPHMKWAHIPAQQMPCQVQCRIAQKIDVIEPVFELDPPRPEIVQAFDADAVGGCIPELEVNFDGDGQVGVEVIAAPLPSGLADHSRQMIHRETLHARNRFVTEREQGIAGRISAGGGNVKIQIVLHAQLRVVDQHRHVREALQHHVIDAGGAKTRGDLRVCGVYTSHSNRVAFQRGLDVLARGVAEFQARQQQRELGAIGECEIVGRQR